MSSAAAIREFLAGDVVQLALQPSQHVALGVHHPVHSIEDGRDLDELGPAWTAIDGAGRILCCYGFALQWPAKDLPAHPSQPRPGERFGGHALAWAMLAGNVGAAHVQITRFARATIAESEITRIEAIVRAGVEAEWRWAELVGFTRVATLRAWGPDGETHLLYERVRDHELNDLTPGVKLEAEPRSLKLEALGAH